MNKEMDIIFLTGLFPIEDYAEILKKSKGAVQNAANNLQWELVKGFDENLNSNFSLINSMYIGSFPKRYKSISIKRKEFYRNKELKRPDINVGFVNLPIFKLYSKYKTIINEIKPWIDNKNSGKKVIIIYAMTGLNLAIANYIKKKNQDVVISLIVPDLPEYMNLSPSPIHQIFKTIEINYINKNIRNIDSFVFLTEHMAKKINVSKPYTVMEGIAPILEELSLKKTEVYDGDFDNTILYTGGIDENYGVIKLIIEFMKIKDQKLKLFICGAGPNEDKVEKLSKLDARIFYFGLLSREEVLYFQSKCTLLINPRSSNEEYTKYSFPSKLLEYMSSGRPVAAYMLDGIPKEYRNHILELNSELDLNVQIREIMKMDITKLNEIGNLAKEFVENNKNKNIQSLRILKLIRENNGENFNG